jgi:hypothetical protein
VKTSVNTRLAWSLLFAVILILLASCSTRSPKLFSSTDWKLGDASSRGAMAHDLVDRKIFLGRQSYEVQNLLGSPDYQDNDSYGYKVAPIERCHFWECRLDVVFDKDSKKVVSVAVAD